MKCRSKLSPGGMGSTIWTPKPPAKAIKAESNVQVAAQLCEQIPAPRRISPTLAVDLEFFIWTFNPALFPRRSQTHRVSLNPTQSTWRALQRADNPSGGSTLWSEKNLF